MRIVADENIPLLQSFFADLGEVKALPGREISREDLMNADVLLVRSVTPVNEALLEGTSVRFVGTATIGCDHIDQAYLASRKISFVSAPGCNAESVAEYVISSLSVLSEVRGFSLDEISVGLIGRGAIGSTLEPMLRSLGVVVKCYDPPKEAAGEENLVSLDEILECDVVSLHVPLEDGGEWPTRHLVDDAFLNRMEGHQVLINTSRGQVVDQSALKRRLARQDGFGVVLDVWWNEPAIDADLAAQCELATPHIAGYSLDGRTAATEIVYQSLCRQFGMPARAKVGQFLSEPPLKKMNFSDSADPDWVLHTAIRACLDLRHDHAQLALALKGANPAVGFDVLRKNYRQRRGFKFVRVKLKSSKAEVVRQLGGLGFQIVNK